MKAVWTPEQERAISLRGSNLLVSAAAGSGKTAVLVERIIRRITEGDRPADIDRLLVVTFTNAAASQMRERIAEAIERKLDEDPENMHLRRQSTLIHHAQITTIDSFCLSVVRDHFNRLELNPDFRVGDPGELKLLRADVMQRMMEDAYASGDGDFLRTVESYAVGKADGGIRELIERLYDLSASYPFPGRQRGLWAEELEKEDLAVDESLWMRSLKEEIRRIAGEMEKRCARALAETEEDGELAFYAPMFESDLLQLRRIRSAETFEGLHRAFEELSFVRKPVKRGFAGDIRRKEYLSALRDRMKKQTEQMRELVLTDSPASIAEKTAQSRAPLLTLLRLCDEFERRFSEAKREKNIVDFGDVEHFALSVLVDEDERPTEAALEYAKRFEEIMIDEYQDSNRVQELLLQSVARADNRFMVGDVKQSIYRFRMARPELFVEKYNTYREEEGPGRRVDLSRNFRSRPEVLEQINLLFSRLMTPALGRIAYDERAALYPGASYPETDEDRRGELLIAAGASEDGEDTPEELAALHAREREAMAVAERIRMLVDRESGVTVTENGRTRPAGYGDIVILLRAMSGWSDVFVRVLNDSGIPAAADLDSGYFDAPEVKLILDYLRVIDNPCQDIPLAAVLHSPICGVSSGEMARIMAEYQLRAEFSGTPRFYRACAWYPENGENRELREKLAAAGRMTEEFRFLARHLSVQELLRRIFARTGYDRLALAMPGGKVRRGNLLQLEQKAKDYAKTSYHGLFNFIRYIENLQKYEVDFGEAAPGERADTVRVMSIHRSKGLEFPIVFVSGLAKQFNRQDSRSRVLLHPDLGIAADAVDLETRVRTKTLRRRVFARQMWLDGLAEELRILYVAMTRAKERLILTACGKTPEEYREKYAAVSGEEGALPYFWLTSAGSYLDWIMMALCAKEQKLWRIGGVGSWDLFAAESKRAEDRESLLERFLNWDSGTVRSPRAREEIRKRFDYRYPYAEQTGMHTKVSVSELKALRLGEEDSSYLYRMEPESAGGGEVLQADCLTEETLREAGPFRKEALNGVRRGTALHRVMEKLDFTDCGSESAVRNQVRALIGEGVVAEEELSGASLRQICQFFAGNLAKRMTNAARRDKLHRENRFTIGVPAAQIGGDYRGGEMILVQGMIDAWFEEEDGITVIDYKSDRVRPEDGETVLTERYAVQLEYYRRAVEQSTGRRVKECRIYSFALGKDFAVRTRETAAEPR